MYKIRWYLLTLALLSGYVIVGQQPEIGQVKIDADVYANRQTVFTVHLLADKVDLGKKYAYEPLVAGRKVSLPYPTPFPIQNL